MSTDLQNQTRHPNFLVIGAGKSGTTWIYRVLKSHPDVFLAAVKETLFFADEYHRGQEWYEGFFKGSAGHSAIGEVSNTYIFHPGTAKRIHAYNPAFKLIASLRNPIDRALSQYLLMIRNAQDSGTFEQVLARHPELLERGLYGRHLGAYLEYFSREQLQVLLFDDLRKGPREFAASLFRFLGVEPIFPDFASTRALPASRSRSRLIAHIVKRTALTVRRMGFPTLVNRVKESRLPKLLYKPLTPEEYPVMLPETRERLTAYFRDDVKALSAIVGRDLVSEWSM